MHVTDRSDARQYALRRLAEGGALDRLLAARIDAFATASVLLDAAAGVPANHDLSHGGVTSRRKTDPLVIAVVEQALREPGASALFESPSARPNDPVVRRSHVPFAVYGDEVAYTVPPGASAEAIAEAYRQAVTFGWVAVVTNGVPIPPSGGVLKDDALRAIAGGATLVLLEALDGEGAVILRR
jgi:hypothetical protein